MIAATCAALSGDPGAVSTGLSVSLILKFPVCPVFTTPLVSSFFVFCLILILCLFSSPEEFD